jgi:CubicO group peptidase (beta-lactamase class C family)
MASFGKRLLFRSYFLFFLFVLPVALYGSAKACSVEFLDGLFNSQMREHNIAGITFSMYSADNGSMTRSWGYSHVEEQRKADGHTGFMIGSVSKLFVWVAVMQLVEQGKLDLDKPVNDYLMGFRLPDSYRPVTMKHLMTHTPGFETNYHLFAKSHELLPTIETYLIENIPLQIFEPGTTPAYSNYGVVLAAYVIEQIIGLTFNDYVDKFVFEPLQMQNTTFRQPASYVISEAKSKGYIFENGRFVTPFQEFVLPAPAGSAVSTASDMIKFMEVFLLNEDTDLPRILSAQSISLMLSLLHAPHSQSDGMGYGFLRLNYHGKEIFWHGGDTYFHHTSFMLVPSLKTGIFMSMNTAGNSFNYLDQSLLILDYLNGNKQELLISKRVNGMNHFAGTYKPSQRKESDYLKLINNFMHVRISGGAEGVLVHWSKDNIELYRPYQEEDVFVNEYKRLIFERNERGKVERFFFSHLPVFEYQRISFRENTKFNVILLIIVLLLALRNIIIPIVRLVKEDKRSRQIHRWFLLLSGILIYLFFILFFTTFSGVEPVIFEKPGGLRLILIIPLASLILFFVAMFFWMQGGIWRRQPISHTFWQFAGFLVMVVFYLQMHFWNFFNFLV